MSHHVPSNEPSPEDKDIAVKLYTRKPGRTVTSPVAPNDGSEGTTQNVPNQLPKGRRENHREDSLSDPGQPLLEPAEIEERVTLERIQGSWAERATRRDTIFKRLLVLADLGAAGLALGALDFVIGQRLLLVSVATLPLIVLIIKVGGLYDRDQRVIRRSTLDEAPALMALAATYALAWSLVTIAVNVHSSRGAVLVLWGATATGLLALRAIARAGGRGLAPRERILIMGHESSRTGLGERLRQDCSDAEVVGFLPLDDPASGTGHSALSSKDLRSVVESMEIDRVLLITMSGDADWTMEAVATAKTVGVKVSIVPNIFEVIGSAVEFDGIGGITVLDLKRPGITRSSAVVKRATDIVGALVGLILAAPLFVVIAIAIRADSPGPVFFLQPRIGRNGKLFQMIKFRSMVATAAAQRQALEPLNESDGLFKITEDPRVTRGGRWLRNASLDELPQLFNVLRGEMSLVGPRPLVPEEDRRIEGRHRDRLQFSPGMTGPWQVLGPKRPPLSEMVKLDYLYGANWSWWSDLKYILRTLGHVAARRGV